MESAEEFPPPGEDDEYGFEPFEQEGESLLGFTEPDAADPAPAGSDNGTPRETGGQAADVSADVPETTGAPLALYRRYRPDTFAEVIGQEHVTDPLQRALVNNRVNHAYLFSGPRGCGKTTSARILARCLNCEQGPTPTPCGRCQSCRDLARGGPGSIDVIEIDAASHGGVEDARDLRERAFFAPVHSRYKIYIVDEAHMVTTAGFNALLKLVEEPPPHVKFIFATTEPDRVIGTIRSRTHHYPFRLVPPKVLQSYLAHLCEAEGIAVEHTVLPLVVRAGAGSVRDSLSVLDQLLGGAAAEGVSYAQATALLGYTPDSLLDEMLDAFAAGDSAGVFSCIDKVIEVGQDPRRFAEDLLHRLRDLVIVAAVPDALSSGLVDAAEDQGERLRSQAAGLGAGELTRAAEVISTGLTDMRGTTAPRLYLELMCARVLLPGSDVDDRGVHARLDRLERRMGMVGTGTAPPAPPSNSVAQPVAEARPRDSGGPSSGETSSPGSGTGGSAPPARDQDGDDHDRSVADDHDQGLSDHGAVHDRQASRATQPEATADEIEKSPTAGSGAVMADGAAGQGASRPTESGAGRADAGSSGTPEQPGLSTADVRRLWPEVLDEVKGRRRFTWVLISQNAQVAEVRDGVLVLALRNVGAKESFARGGSEDVLIDSLVEVLGVNLRIETIVDEAPGQAPGGSAGGGPQGGGAGGLGVRPEPEAPNADPWAAAARPQGAGDQLGTTGDTPADLRPGNGAAAPDERQRRTPEQAPRADLSEPAPPGPGRDDLEPPHLEADEMAGAELADGPPATGAVSDAPASERPGPGRSGPEQSGPEQSGPERRGSTGPSGGREDSDQEGASRTGPGQAHSGRRPSGAGAGPESAAPTQNGSRQDPPQPERTPAPPRGEDAARASDRARMSARARQGIRPTRRGKPAGQGPEEPEPDPYEDYDPDAPDLATDATPVELLTRHLGAELISEEETPR